MRDVTAELDTLRLHGHRRRAVDLVAQGGGVDSSPWLVAHLLQTESTDRAAIARLADESLAQAVHNAVLIGGPGTGKRYRAEPVGVAGITRHGKRVRVDSAVKLINALERKKADRRTGRIAGHLTRIDTVAIDELHHLPSRQPA